MILKEAYRYQNYLQRLISSTERMLSNRAFVTITKQEHLRKKQTLMPMMKLLFCQNLIMKSILQWILLTF